VWGRGASMRCAEYMSTEVRCLSTPKASLMHGVDEASGAGRASMRRAGGWHPSTRKSLLDAIQKLRQRTPPEDAARASSMRRRRRESARGGAAYT
jgi:hypothetical protein